MRDGWIAVVGVAEGLFIVAMLLAVRAWTRRHPPAS